MGVRIVTDSSCDLPEDLVEQHRIEIVPLTIRFGHEELIDRKELSTAEFWDRVR
ncbi:MAG: DegV family protein, partial [Acidimicrobiia bacterium]|nr:DegV family protein [Acidimicrobiia bacterium]